MSLFTVRGLSLRAEGMRVDSDMAPASFDTMALFRFVTVHGASIGPR